MMDLAPRQAINQHRDHEGRQPQDMASIKVLGLRVELQNLFQMTIMMISLEFPG